MRKSYVDMGRGLITIPKELTKTDREKCIFIHPQLKPILQEALARSKSTYVFPNWDGSMLNKNAIRIKMIEICRKTNIPKATIHDLRHTWNTISSVKGLSAEARQKIGGWASRTVMDLVYTHIPTDRIRAEYFAIDYLPRPSDPLNVTVMSPNEKPKDL
jgi:integrase